MEMQQNIHRKLSLHSDLQSPRLSLSELQNPAQHQDVKCDVKQYLVIVVRVVNLHNIPTKGKKNLDIKS